jgi:rubrerythrin
VAELRTTSDLLEIAIRVERCVLDFYKRMRDHIVHKHGREIFDSLATEEGRHIVVLRRLLEQSDEDEYGASTKGYTRSLDGLVSHAMRAFNKAEELTTTEDAVEALGIGVELEVESIFYVTELIEVLGEECKDILVSILNDEESHLSKLIAMIKKSQF